MFGKKRIRIETNHYMVRKEYGQRQIIIRLEKNTDRDKSLYGQKKTTDSDRTLYSRALIQTEHFMVKNKRTNNPILYWKTTGSDRTC